MRRLRHSVGKLARMAALAFALALAAPATALAQCPQTTLGEVEQEVMCPICGTPLALATEAPQAQRQRAFIVERVERCESKDDIKAALVGEFGPGVLATPGGGGFDLAAYALPAVGVLAAVGGIGLATARWRRGRLAGGEATGERGRRAAATPSSGDQARLERDLKRYDL